MMTEQRNARKMHAQNRRLPAEYADKFERMLGAKSGEFFQACRTKEPKSIWCNSLKTGPDELKKELESRGFALSQLPFHENAFSVEKPDRPGQDEAFSEGRFNLQEKAAMIPAIALEPKEGERVLDAFAAPGNKTLQLSCLCDNSSEIIALEREPARMRVLRSNISKFGMDSVRAMQLDFQKFKDRDGFDRILLDAPCSSEGLVRKRLDGLSEWSQKKVLNMAKRQKKAIARGFALLRTGGTLVYSTCSLSPEEDEEVIAHLLEKCDGVKVEKIEINGATASPGLLEYDGKKYDERVRLCSRFYPHEWDCQPFFAAKITKE